MSDDPTIPPPPPQIPPPVNALPLVDPPTESGLAPNIAAGLAELLSLVGGLVFYFIEKKNAFVRFHALQSAYLGAAFFVFCTAMGLLCAIPFIGVLFSVLMFVIFPLAGLLYSVLLVIATFQAFNSKEWEVPWIGKLARRHLAEGVFFFTKSPAP